MPPFQNAYPILLLRLNNKVGKIKLSKAGGAASYPAYAHTIFLSSYQGCGAGAALFSRSQSRYKARSASAPAPSPARDSKGLPGTNQIVMKTQCIQSRMLMCDFLFNF